MDATRFPAICAGESAPRSIVPTTRNRIKEARCLVDSARPVTVDEEYHVHWSERG